MNGGERVAQVLKAHGVPFVFTLCCGGVARYRTSTNRLLSGRM